MSTTNRRPTGLSPADAAAEWLADQVAARVVHALAPRLHRLEAQLRALGKTTHRMEITMSEIDDKVAELDKDVQDLADATTAVGQKLDADKAELDSVKEQLAEALAGNPEASAALDRAIAGVSAASKTLRDLGSDTSQVVPPSDPIVGDGGDTTSGDPGSEGNPAPNPPDPGAVDIPDA